jgi:hypothetical protein
MKKTTRIAPTARGYVAVISVNGRAIVTTLPAANRNDAARHGVKLFALI